MKTKKVYLYSFYERCWHWLQAVGILLLLWTGLEIHAPQKFCGLGLQRAILLHNFLGFVLILNAFLALFYHLTSGAIRQYLPEPKDFLSLAVKQALYYLRGIFRQEPHPFEKSVRKKLNPLQKITYLAILNVLLPMQVITGVLIWKAQDWNRLIESLGGLQWVAAVHSFGSWLFASFIVVHVYLTTTGKTPLSNLKAMITGWEELDEENSLEKQTDGKE